MTLGEKASRSFTKFDLKIVSKQQSMTKLHEAPAPTCMMSHMMPVRWNPLDDTATVTSRFILLCVLISCSLFSFDSSLRLSSNDGLGMLANRCRNFTYSRQAFWYLTVTKQRRTNELNSVWEQMSKENSKNLRSAVCENILVGEYLNLEEEIKWIQRRFVTCRNTHWVRLAIWLPIMVVKMVLL